MANILSTWICIDDTTSSSYFPSAKGNSADYSVQAIYWKCLAVCVFTARKFNPDLRLAVFSNVKDLPVIGEVDFKKLFDSLEIEFYTTPFEYQTPDRYYDNWRNQFYEFSVFKYVLSSPNFRNEDAFILLDSDCVITKDLSEVFHLIKKNECITYIIDYKLDYKINGNSRSDMQTIFQELQGKKINEIPKYHAGEFLGVTINSLKRLMEVFYPTWGELLNFHKKNLPRLHEEAHVLSYLYYTCGYPGGEANSFIKRLWTDPTTMRNVESEDESLIIWHLPAEKRYGFKEMFDLLSKRHFLLEVYPRDGEFVEKLKKVFQVPKISFKRKIYYSVKKMGKRVLQKR